MLTASHQSLSSGVASMSVRRALIKAPSLPLQLSNEALALELSEGVRETRPALQKRNNALQKLETLMYSFDNITNRECQNFIFVKAV